MATDLIVSDAGEILRDDGQRPQHLNLTGQLGFAPGQGIRQEQLSFSPGEFSIIAAATLLVTSDVPRMNLPDAATSQIAVVFQPPNWWNAFNIVVSQANEHSATGNVRWRTRVKEIDFFTQALAGTLLLDDTVTDASPGANGQVNFRVASAGVTRAPGAFGSCYVLEIARIGADGADTLAGAMSILGVTIGRV